MKLTKAMINILVKAKNNRGRAVIIQKQELIAKALHDKGFGTLIIYVPFFPDENTQREFLLSPKGKEALKHQP